MKKDKNLRNAAIAMVLLAIIILVPITLRKPKVESYEYNGFEFTKIGDMWYTEVQNLRTNKVYRIELRYDPKNVDDVPVEGNPRKFVKALDPFESKAAYFTFNPLGENMTYVALVAADLSKNLKDVMDIQLLPACTINETEACSELPVVDCGIKDKMIILVNESEEAKIKMQDNCLILEGKEKELIRASNKLLLMLYGIIS